MFFIAALLGLVGLTYVAVHLAIFGLAYQYRHQILLAFAAAVILCSLWEQHKGAY